MPVSVHIDDDHALLVFVFRGVVTPANILQLISDLPKYSTSVGTMDRINYFDKNADLSLIDFNALMVIKQRVSESLDNEVNKSKLSYRSAFVVKSTSNLGIVRLYRANWELDHDPNFQIFESTGEALDWLNKDDIVKNQIEEWIRSSE